MHASPDLLALLALGERVGSSEEHAHLAECSECRAELQSLRAVADVGRRTTEGDVMASPPPQVWQRIQEELQLGSGSVRPRVDAEPAPVIIPTPDRRGVRAATFVLAAALALVVGVGLGVDYGRAAPAATAVASVQLNAMPRFAGSSGRAVVERDRHGNRTLVVQISSPVPPTGPREVWLTNTLAEPMMAMGYLTGDTGRFPIPPTVQLSQSPLVDISQEPAHDTNPAHSGNSILRGRLPV